VRQVGPGAEGRLRPGHHHRTDVRIGIDGVERGHDLVHQPERQGIAAAGGIERDERDPIPDLGAELNHGRQSSMKAM
jgi:hypothetical protein